jgi:hypothetical protein
VLIQFDSVLKFIVIDNNSTVEVDVVRKESSLLQKDCIVIDNATPIRVMPVVIIGSRVSRLVASDDLTILNVLEEDWVVVPEVAVSVGSVWT